MQMKHFALAMSTLAASFCLLVGVGLMLRGPDPVWVGAVPAALGLAWLLTVPRR